METTIADKWPLGLTWLTRTVPYKAVGQSTGSTLVVESGSKVIPDTLDGVP